MALREVNKTTGDTSRIVSGGTLFADNPIGTIIPYGGASAPSGWFLCQGQAVSRTNYAELFAVIGTAFGSGDGSTTFNLPDLRNKTTMGGGTLGTSSAGALPNITGGRDNTLSDMAWLGDGASAGAIKHGTPLQNYQLPADGALGSFAPLLFDASKSSNLYKNNQSYVEPANVRVNYIIKAKMVAVPADFMSAVESIVGTLISHKHLTGGDTYSNETLASVWDIIEFSDKFCLCIGQNTVTGTLSARGAFNMQLPSGYTYENIISANAFANGNTEWVTRASHIAGNGALAYLGAGSYAPGYLRFILIATKA